MLFSWISSSLRWSANGSRRVRRLESSSVGLPFTYFGSTWAPRRIAM
jgi:hypothetical protein